MTNMTKRTVSRVPVSDASKRRFLIRMVTVLIGGMVLDGYVLGIIGPVSGTMAEDLQLTALWQGLIAAGVAFVGAGLSQWLAPETKGKSLTEAAAGYAH